MPHSPARFPPLTPKPHTFAKLNSSGPACDDFLSEQGILGECTEQALKQILAFQIKAAMGKDHLSKTAMAGGCKPAAAPWTACLIPRTPA
jgi:hypothetical protein